MGTFVLILFLINCSHAPKINNICFYIPADGHECSNVDQSTNAVLAVLLYCFVFIDIMSESLGWLLHNKEGLKIMVQPSSLPL